MKGGEKMKKGKKNVVIVVLLLLLAVTAGFAAYTYAKYTSSFSKDASVSVASWTFNGDNASETLSVNLAQNYDTNKLASGKIAPGTAGSFSINLKNTSDVGVSYTITMGSPASGSIPTNLKFYSDDTYQTEITSTGLTGTLNVGATATTKTIYWKWDYETANGDSADTSDGTAHASLTIPVTITGTQVQPTA